MPHSCMWKNLTYMSIRSAIGRHLRHGRLFAFEPEFSSDQCVRSFVYGEEIKTLFDGPWVAASCATRVASVLADIESFVRGQEVVISLVPFQADDALFGLLSRADQRIWEFRSRKPKPGIRLFGSWADVDIFVATTWYPRSLGWNGRQALGDRHGPLWETAKKQCEEKWTELFPQFEKLGGEDIHDYISERVTSAHSL